MSVKFTTIPTKRLATSITGASTSIQLNNILGWDGVALTSSDLGIGDAVYAVLRDSNNTVMEIMELDRTTIASASITITRRGLMFDGTLLTEVSANKLTWIKNDTLVELGSDSPQFFQYLKEYIDSVAIAGAPNASTTTKGIVEIATLAEINANTGTGGTAAVLTVDPATLVTSKYGRGTNYYGYAADAGANDTYAITCSPAPTAYTAGDRFTFKANTANTGAATLNVNSLGAKTIKKNYNGDLSNNDILANQIVEVVYDGTNMQIMTITSSPTPTVRVYTADNTWSKPTGLKYIEVEVQAAGGGSGGADAAGSADSASAGGGGGGYSRKLIAAGTLSATETVTVGVGGTAGSNTGGDGGTGGTSSFGSHLSATGGTGGGGDDSGSNGGPGGVGSSGDLNTTGSDGSAPPSKSGSTGSLFYGGNGGSSVLGGGGRSASVGCVYGGGAGGAVSSSGGQASGSVGAAGVVIVKEYL